MRAFEAFPAVVTMAAVAVLGLVGCGAVKPIEPAETAVLIRAGAATATALGLRHGIDEKAERSEVAKQISAGASVALQVVSGGDPPTGAEILGLLQDYLPLQAIPPEVRVALQGALDILMARLEIPDPEEVASAEALLYVRAFLEGVRDGADAV